MENNMTNHRKQQIKSFPSIQIAQKTIFQAILWATIVFAVGSCKPDSTQKPKQPDQKHLTSQISGRIYIVKTKLRFRSSPAQNSKIIRNFNAGEEVLLLEKTTKSETIDGHQGHWLKIKDTRGSEGYVFENYLSVKKYKKPEIEFEKAQKYEDQGLYDFALVYYKTLMEKYKDYTSSEMDSFFHFCGGLYACARDRISIIQCKQKRSGSKYFTTPEFGQKQIVQILKNKGQSKNKLADLAACEFIIGIPNSGSIFIVEPANIRGSLQKILANIQWDKKPQIHKTQQQIDFVYSGKANNTTYQFRFKKSKHKGWEWTAFLTRDPKLYK